MTKLAQAYRKRIAAGRDLRHAQAMNLGAIMAGRGKGCITSNEGAELRSQIARVQPRMDDRDARRGIAWLRGLAYTPTGRPRSSSPLGYRECSILEDADHVRLVGFHYVDTGYHWHDSYRPVYRVVARDGRHFDYVIGATRSDALSSARGPRVTITG